MESELREGYKMTELGALPEEWEVTKLGDICNIKMGQSPPSSSYNDNGNGLPFFQGNADFGTKFPTVKSYCNEPLKIANVDDILMSVRAPVGALNISNVRCCIGRGLTAINADKNNSQTFMYYLLQSCVGILNKFATGSTFTAINQKELNILLIARPPLPEQRRIATILSTLDETVEHTEALIEKYKNVKAGLMSDLLTRGVDEEGRIRSEETHRFKNSALGRVPEEWEFGGFEDMVDKSNKNAIKPGPFGSSLKKEFYVDDGYRVYGQEQVIAGTLSIGDYYVNKHKFEELKSFRIDIDDVLISLVGTTGKVLVVPSKFESGIINPRLLKITPDKRKSNSKFISYLLISGIITNQLATLSHGGTMDVLNGTTIRKLRFGIPSLKEQRRIAEILTAADQRIEKEEAYRDKLLQLKKGLMQDLLTGKVRVKDSSVQMVEQSEN